MLLEGATVDEVYAHMDKFEKAESENPFKRFENADGGEVNRAKQEAEAAEQAAKEAQKPAPEKKEGAPSDAEEKKPDEKEDKGE